MICIVFQSVSLGYFSRGLNTHSMLIYAIFFTMKQIDYQKLVLQTEQTAIQCWIAGEAAMISSVAVSEKTKIPANSRMFIPVEIPCRDKLSTNCVVEPSIHICQEKT